MPVGGGGRTPVGDGAHPGVVRRDGGADVAVVGVQSLAQVVAAVADVDARVLEVGGREGDAAGLVGDLRPRSPAGSA